MKILNKWKININQLKGAIKMKKTNLNQLESIKELDRKIVETKEVINEQEKTIKMADDYYQKVIENTEKFWTHKNA